MGIRNTTDDMRDPAEKLLFLADAMGHGSDGAIERQERDGQRQLLVSDRLPTDTHRTDREFEAAGRIDEDEWRTRVGIARLAVGREDPDLRGGEGGDRA